MLQPTYTFEIDYIQSSCAESEVVYNYDILTSSLAYLIITQYISFHIACQILVQRTYVPLNKFVPESVYC